MLEIKSAGMRGRSAMDAFFCSSLRPKYFSLQFESNRSFFSIDEQGMTDVTII